MPKTPSSDAKAEYWRLGCTTTLIQHISNGNDIGAYDDDSIIHYPTVAFEDGLLTIQAIDAHAR